MKRILSGLVLMAGAGAVIAGGLTGAFFSDTEASTGNTFAAGAVDLKIDNDSYYNGNRCTNVGTEQNPVWEWQGNALYPVPGTECTTSFPLSDLDNGLLFFDFHDLKPDDEGEDTISLHVQNDAWVCMDVSLTSNDDVSSTEPELEVDEENTDDAWDGELAQNIQMVWWADDGDNVLEHGETILTGDGTAQGGVETLYNLATSTPFSVALADATHNVWDPQNPGPVPANEEVYIGKAWCFGDLTIDAVPFDTGIDPSVDPGVDCDGTALGNETQTDAATLDIAFRASQARHNPDFTCGEEDDRFANITVTKTVNNDNGGNNTVPDFQLFLDGIVDVPLSSGVPVNVNPGSYTVSELGAQGYEATFGGDCDADGNVILNEGENKSCTIANDDIKPNITLIKQVINNNGGTAVATAFKMRVNGVLVPSGSSRSVNSNTNVTITEDAFAGYTATGISGAGCPGSLGAIFQLDEGVAITCTITNDDNP